MPVAAVIAGGRPRVSSGSLITTPGIICGWKMIFFWWVASLTTTPARPTSEPVPAVVGTATIGAMPPGSARCRPGRRCPPVPDVFEVPQRPRLPGHERDQLAGIQRRTAAEGNHAIVGAGAVGAEAIFDVGGDGIPAHPREQAASRHKLAG